MNRPPLNQAEPSLSPRPDPLAIVGRVRKAHGVRGDLVVEPITDSPDAVFASGARVFMGTTPGPTPASHVLVELGDASPHGNGIRVHVAGVDDRNAADLLRNRCFFVPFDELPAPADQDVFLHDLIGMAVVNPAGETLGSVRGWYELPQGVMLEVDRDGGEVLVPYEAFVREVSAEERRLVVELPEGFLD